MRRRRASIPKPALVMALAILLGAGAPMPGGAAPGDQGLAKAKEAASALQAGRAAEAVLLYTAALADGGLTTDRRASFLNDRGVAQARLGKLREAIDDFNTSVRLAPEAASTYNNRGNVLLALGIAAEAEKDFNRALVLAPGFAAAYVNRANARGLAGDTAGAMADFTRAIRLSPKLPAAYGGRGRLHLASNRPHASIRDFNRAVANDQRYGPGYRLRADAQILLGRFDEAIADLSRAVAFDPANGDLYQARGYAYLGARNPASAIKDFQRAAEIAPRLAAPLEGLAMAQARVGAYDDALDTLSRALEIEPRSGRAYAYRAIVYKLMGQVDLGMKDLDRALRLDGAAPETRWARGEILEAGGQRDETVAELRAALAGKPVLREAAFALERLGAQEPRDAEVAELAFERWRVFVSKGRYYTTSAELPRLNVPLETVNEGAVPRLLELEVKGGEQAGIAILRFAAGQAEGTSGPEDVEHGAVIDLETRTVLAVETMRQGTRRASWVWEEDQLVVTDLDGFKQAYDFKGRRASDAIAKAEPAPQKIAKPRPRPPQPSGQAWLPWGQPWGGPSGGGSGQRRQPKTLFEMLFSN